VPYLTYGPDASRLHTSSALGDLVAAAEPRQALVEQADRIATRLLVRPYGIRTTMHEPSMPVPSVVGPYVLAAHRTPSGTHRIAAVVVVRPQAMVVAHHEPSESGLTVRERQVMSLIAIGLGSKQIAARLGISPHTARHHTERVFEKLGVRSRAAVASLAAVGGRRPGSTPQTSTLASGASRGYQER
jgi:DNA-binding CsgD family transcriptional regulator